MYAGILGARLSDVGVVLVYNNSASAPFGQERVAWRLDLERMLTTSSCTKTRALDINRVKCIAGRCVVHRRQPGILRAGPNDQRLKPPRRRRLDKDCERKAPHVASTVESVKAVPTHTNI